MGRSAIAAGAALIAAAGAVKGVLSRGVSSGGGGGGGGRTQSGPSTTHQTPFGSVPDIIIEGDKLRVVLDKNRNNRGRKGG